MDEFMKYLLQIKESMFNHSVSDVHIVLGNESCDLDSAVSSLAYAFYLHSTIYSDKTDITVIPILNVVQEDFPLRTEIVFVIEKYLGIDLNKLIYRDTVDLLDYQTNFNIKVTLVDHHVLCTNDRFLKDKVVEIFDHRPEDSHANWCKAKVKVKLTQVASCCTLIAQEILSGSRRTLPSTLLQMLYDTIIFDTIGFPETAGKATKLDFTIAEKLESLLMLHNQVGNRYKKYEEIWAAHNNVAHLTTHQLLRKDLKTVDGVLVPTLPMLVKTYLNKRVDCQEVLEKFMKSRNAKCVLLIGIETTIDITKNAKRDVGFYPCGVGNEFLEALLEKLTSIESFQFTEESVDKDKIRCFKQINFRASRKQIIPIVQDLNRLAEKHL